MLWRAAPQPTRLGRWFCGLWPDRNPLRRASDRADAAIIACLIVALLIGMPLVAAVVGLWTYDAEYRAEHAQAAWRQVSAVLLTDAGRAPAAVGPSTLRRVLAVWTGPNGMKRTGRVPAQMNARAGTVRRIWVDSSGYLSAAPLTHREVEWRAAQAAMLASAGLAVVLLCAAALARRILDRRRMAAWDTAWQAIGPRWTIQH
jgi:hypothetical protein